MSNEEASSNAPSDTCSSSRIRVIKFNHTWTVENFSFFLDKTVFQSPIFDAEVNDGIQWYLKLYPKGNDEHCRDYISLFLYVSSCGGSEVRATYEISILNTEEKSIKLSSLHEPGILKVGEGWGWNRFVLRDFLFKDYDSFLPDDKLTVHCKVSYALDTEDVLSQLLQKQPKHVAGCDVSGVFGRLLESQALSDVVLEVNGKKFHAHKAILAARSPVFKALFEHDLEGKKTSRVKMSGTDEKTLSDLLRFIYTGKAEVPDRMTELLATIRNHVSTGASPVANPSEENSTDAEEAAEKTRKAKLSATELHDLEENRLKKSSTTLGAEPQASIKKFSGDERAFYGWWRDFRENVHDRRDLSFGQKLTHLRNRLEGEAARAIPGTAHEETEYLEKLSSLFIRFGNVGAMPIEMILHSLEMSKHCSIMEDGPLRSKLERIDSRLNFLRTLDPEIMGNERACASADGIRDSIYKALPSWNRLVRPENLSGKRKEDRFGAMVSDAVKRLVGSSAPREVLTPETTTNGLNSSCPFCEHSHLPSECQSELTAEEKKDRLLKAGFCLKCLNREHTGEDCTSQILCVQCNRNHRGILFAEDSETPRDPRDDDSDAAESSFELIPDVKTFQVCLN